MFYYKTGARKGFCHEEREVSEVQWLGDKAKGQNGVEPDPFVKKHKDRPCIG